MEGSKQKALPEQSNVDRYQIHERLPASYNGFVIELERRESMIDRATNAYRNFGKLYYSWEDDKTICYMIIAAFYDQSSAKRYFLNVIKPQFPQARLIKIQNVSMKVIEG